MGIARADPQLRGLRNCEEFRVWGTADTAQSNSSCHSGQFTMGPDFHTTSGYTMGHPPSPLSPRCFPHNYHRHSYESSFLKFGRSWRRAHLQTNSESAAAATDSHSEKQSNDYELTRAIPSDDSECKSHGHNRLFKDKQLLSQNRNSSFTITQHLIRIACGGGRRMP